MALRVTFDLEEEDLKYFRAQIRKARKSAQGANEEEIVARADEMITEVEKAGAPQFVMQRLARLRSAVAMLRDEEWALAANERKNVVSALAYFADPQDIIPDSVPVIGYIDDAIMIELVVRELSHEIDAFEDFCRYRQEEASRNRNPNISREEWLADQRRKLYARMRRRRSGGRASGSNGRPRYRLF